MPVLIACISSFAGVSRRTRDIVQSRITEGNHNMRKSMKTKALILESCLGCRRVNSVTSNGYAGKEIFGVEVKTNGSENGTSDAQRSF
jgi:hypothetical protein